MQEEEKLIIADGFESAFIGVAYPWQNGNKPVAVYDKEACIMQLMEQMECDYAEALEYFEFKVEGAYVGEQTPIFVSSDSRNQAVEVF